MYHRTPILDSLTDVHREETWLQALRHGAIPREVGRLISIVGLAAFS